MVLLSGLCQIYILYFDKVKGQIPLLIFPNECIKNNEQELHPIKFHPIWYMDAENQRGFEQVNLVYKGKVYIAKKFKIFLKRKKRRVRFKDENFDIAVIIIVLPKKSDIYGSDLLRIITKTIKKNFRTLLYHIVESEILKENLIKTPKIIEIIKRGDFIKENIKNQVKKIWERYFNSIKHYYEKDQSLVSF